MGGVVDHGGSTAPSHDLAGIENDIVSVFLLVIALCIFIIRWWYYGGESEAPDSE